MDLHLLLLDAPSGNGKKIDAEYFEHLKSTMLDMYNRLKEEGRKLKTSKRGWETLKSYDQRTAKEIESLESRLDALKASSDEKLNSGVFDAKSLLRDSDNEVAEFKKIFKSIKSELDSYADNGRLSLAQKAFADQIDQFFESAKYSFDIIDSSFKGDVDMSATTSKGSSRYNELPNLLEKLGEIFYNFFNEIQDEYAIVTEVKISEQNSKAEAERAFSEAESNYVDSSHAARAAMDQAKEALQAIAMEHDMKSKELASEEEKLKDIDSKMADISKSIKINEAAKAGLNPEASNYAEAVAEFDAVIEKLTTEIDALKSEANDLDAAINELRDQITALKGEIAKHEVEIRQIDEDMARAKADFEDKRSQYEEDIFNLNTSLQKIEVRRAAIHEKFMYYVEDFDSISAKVDEILSLGYNDGENDWTRDMAYDFIKNNFADLAVKEAWAQIDTMKADYEMARAEYEKSRAEQNAEIENSIFKLGELGSQLRQMEKEADVDHFNEVMAELNATIADLEAKNTDLDATIADLESSIAESTAALADSKAAKEAAETDLAVAEVTAAELTADLDKVESDLSAMKAQLSDQGAVLAALEAEKVALDPADPDYATKLAAIDASIASETAKNDEMKEVYDKMKAKLASLETELMAVTDDVKSFTSAIAAATAEIENLNVQIADGEASIESNKSKHAELKSQLAEVQKEKDDIQTIFDTATAGLAEATQLYADHKNHILKVQEDFALFVEESEMSLKVAMSDIETAIENVSAIDTFRAKVSFGGPVNIRIDEKVTGYHAE